MQAWYSQRRMPEQRRHKRRHLIYYLDVFDRSTGARLGSLGDLTAQGMLLLADRPYVSGAELALEVELPVASGFQGGRFAVDARVMWSDVDSNPAYHCVGLAFEDLGDTEEAIVHYLIKLLSFAD